MGEADELLRHVLEHGDIVGRDNAGRTILQLTVDNRLLERLVAFGADAAEGGDDDEPYEVPPVSACWLDEGARP